MKKILAILLTAYMLFSVTSCASPDAPITTNTPKTETAENTEQSDLTITHPTVISPDTKPIDERLESIFSYGGSYSQSIAGNEINTSTKSFDDKNVEKTKKLTVNNKEITLNYDYSITSNLSNYIAHFYTTEDGAISTIKFDANGNIISVVGNLIDLPEISENATLEQIQTSIEPYVSKFIDLSKYPEVVRSANSLIYYQVAECGYMTNFLSINYNKYYSEENYLRSLVFDEKISDQTAKSTKINKKLENELLELALKQRYTSDGIQYIKYDCSETNPFARRLIMHNNVLYVDYTVDVYFKYLHNNEESTDLTHIMIPVSLMSPTDSDSTIK